jgi:hypothetical protein
MLLSPIQSERLSAVKRTNRAWRNAKRDANERAKIIAAREIADYQIAMDIQVRRALNAGVPKAQIGSTGLGTSSPKTVADSLERTAGLARLNPTLFQSPSDESAPDAAQFHTAADL